MGGIDIQFHALPSELFELAEECTTKYKLEAVVMQFFSDFKAILVDKHDFKSSLEKLETVDQIYFCIANPDILVDSPYEFIGKNPDSLVLTIGKYDNVSLKESSLAAKTNNSSALNVWKKIAKKLKAITLTGAWVVNPYNGAKGFYKNHRYTNAAKKLSEEGVKILPIAGWNYFILNSEG